MDDTTSLNNSGSGTTPNWNGTGTSPGQPSPSAPPSTPAAGAGGSEKTSTTSGAPSNIETDNLDADVMTTAQSDNQQLSINASVSSSSSTYNTYPNHPELQQALINDPALAANALQKIQNPFSSKEGIEESLKTLLATTVPTDDSEYANVVVTNPQINELAQETGVPAGDIQHNVQTEENTQFATLVKQYSPAVADQLTFARYTPQGANLSPEMQQLSNSINQQVQEGTANAFGFSDDFTGVPVDGSDFNAKFTAETENTFQSLVDGKVADGTISEDDAKTLTSMYNGLATGTSSLQNLLKQLEGQVTTQLQAKYGFDAAYQPQPDTAFYNNVVNGDFSQTYQKMVEKYTGTATAAQQALLKKYAANPNDPTIPDSIKQLAKQIASEQNLLLNAYPNPQNSSLPENLKATAQQMMTESINSVIKDYNLDSSWQPTIASVSPANNQPNLQLANNSIAMAKDVVSKATTIANGMPSGPELSSFMSFLKIISVALLSLQNSIYAMQAAQTKTSKQMSAAKLDMQLDNIANHQRAADREREKGGKMASMGPLTHVISIVTGVAACAMACGLIGPVGLIIAAAFLADSAASWGTGSNTDPINEMFQKSSDALPPPAAIAVNLLISGAISYASMNPVLAVNLMCQDSLAVQNGVKMCGGNAEAQAITAMAVTTVVEIALIAALVILTGGAAAPLAAETAEEMVATTFGVSLRTAQIIVRTTLIAQAIVTSSLQVTADAININNNILLAEIDIIQGEAQASSALIEAMITVLKQAIDKLLDLLQGESDTITSISNFQGQKWTDASQLITQIAAARAG